MTIHKSGAEPYQKIFIREAFNSLADVDMDLERLQDMQQIVSIYIGRGQHRVLNADDSYPVNFDGGSPIRGRALAVVNKKASDVTVAEWGEFIPTLRDPILLKAYRERNYLQDDAPLQVIYLDPRSYAVYRPVLDDDDIKPVLSNPVIRMM